MTDDLLTIDEAAARLRCSTKTLRRWVQRGVLKERRVGSGRLLFVMPELASVILGAGCDSSISTSVPPLSAADSDEGWIGEMVGNSNARKSG